LISFSFGRHAIVTGTDQRDSKSVGEATASSFVSGVCWSGTS